MSEVMQFASDHQGEFAMLAFFLLSIGGVIVKLTPTERDNVWWNASFGKLLSYLKPGNKK